MQGGHSWLVWKRWMEQVLALGLKAMLCWVSLALGNGSSVSKGMKHLVTGGGGGGCAF